MGVGEDLQLHSAIQTSRTASGPGREVELLADIIDETAIDSFSRSGLCCRKSAGCVRPPALPSSRVRMREPERPIRLLRIIHVAVHVCVAVAVCSVALAQPPQQPNSNSNDAVGRESLRAFSRQSAPELVSHYFDQPRLQLFVIRRLISLDDPRAIPALRNAFETQTEPLTRQFIAAALVWLGETDQKYFDYIAGRAREAVNSDIPFSSHSVTALSASDSGDFEESEEVRSWAQAHNVPIVQAVWNATVEIPGAVQALAVARDRRSVPILLEALQSPNVLVVQEAAFGLARMHETSAIDPIIAICQRLDAKNRPWMAKPLLYFSSKKAQEVARSMIGDSSRLQLWRKDVNHEEAIRAETANLSQAVQWLDQASVPLGQFSQAMKGGDSIEADEALKDYLRDFSNARNALARLPADKVDDGLALGVLDRLERQQSTLDQIRRHAPSGSERAATEAENQLVLTRRMMQEKVAQEAQ